MHCLQLVNNDLGFLFFVFFLKKEKKYVLNAVVLVLLFTALSLFLFYPVYFCIFLNQSSNES